MLLGRGSATKVDANTSISCLIFTKCMLLKPVRVQTVVTFIKNDSYWTASLPYLFTSSLGYWTAEIRFMIVVHLKN